MSESDAAELSDRLFDFCKSESLSEEGLCEIIIGRFGLTPNTNNDHLHDGHNFSYDFFIKACRNSNVTEEIIRLLIEYFPDAPSKIYLDDDSWNTPLHWACGNKNMKANVIQLLIEAAPDSVSWANFEGCFPIHYLCLCCGKDRNEKAAMEILRLLLDVHPESIRYNTDAGELPLHYAALGRSPEFCQPLIESYPESLQISTDYGDLPLHFACRQNILPTVKYLYNMYPDAINHATTSSGHYPIHDAVLGGGLLNCNKTASIDIVKFLLQLPGVKEQKFEGTKSLLHFACIQSYKLSTIEAGIQIIGAIYDADPKAIDDDSITASVHRWREEIQAFINGEMVYARQARDRRVMMTPDENGQLPLHRALRNNVRLGSFKLLTEGNPSAARNVDNNGSLPLHLACEYHDSPRVIEHLIDFCPTTLRHIDIDHNTVLHYACRGAKYGTITMLLDRYNAGLVSLMNVHNQLPINMLFESNSVEDRESIEYTDCVLRLLRAYPETMVMNIGMQ